MSFDELAENEALMSQEWSSDELAVKLRSRDVYTPLGVVLRCLYTSRCKSTHDEPWGSRVERSHGELWGSGLEAYFRSAVMIMDREVSWWAKRTWCWGHLSVGHNNRGSWGLIGEPRGPEAEATFRLAIMIADREVSWWAKRTWCWMITDHEVSWWAKRTWCWSHLSVDHNDHESWGLMVSQEDLMLNDHRSWGLMVSQEDLKLISILTVSHEDRESRGLIEICVTLPINSLWKAN